MSSETIRPPALWQLYPRQTAAIVVLLLGLATIAGAWAFELIGGYIPCPLCLQERIPYYVGLPLALIALVLSPRPWPSRAALFLTAVTFVVSAGLGVYHAGAEWAWWQGPASCAAAGGTPLNPGDLLEELERIRVVSCTDPSWRFPNAQWGLSFAGWNAVISIVLAAVALWGALAMKPAPARRYGSSSVSQ
jgi:disulfide bond formation protein DsbB